MTAKSIQAPTGGLNSFDSLDDMESDEAVFLNNWIPDSGMCRMRGGAEEFVDTGGSDIGTLVQYEYSGGNLFICAVDDKIMDITGGVASTLGTGFTNPRWQTVVFAEKLLLCNGSNDPQQYDGTTLAAIDFTGSTGLTPAALIGCTVYQGRVFYWENASPVFWYAAAASYAGALESFDLSFIAKRGGVIVTVFTWSMDAGDGMDDFLCFLMSTGEAIVYQGTDPAAIANWTLVGKYKTGQPISVRGNISIAGDELILTRSGWVSMKSIVTKGEYRDSEMTRNMRGLSRFAASEYYFNNNWDMVFYPGGPYILINIPISDGIAYEQHVLNTNTLKWSTFSGWVSNTYGIYDQSFFYGSNNGIVYQCDKGPADDGKEILTDALPAYNYLSGRANNKQLEGIRVVTTSSEPENIALTPTADYLIPDAPGTNQSTKVAASTPWGSPWGSPWESGVTQKASGSWQNKSIYGYSISYRMAISTNYETVLWLSTQLMYKDGGVI
jgi:hypothetical protein